MGVANAGMIPADAGRSVNRAWRLSWTPASPVLPNGEGGGRDTSAKRASDSVAAGCTGSKRIDGGMGSWEGMAGWDREKAWRDGIVGRYGGMGLWDNLIRSSLSKQSRFRCPRGPDRRYEWRVRSSEL